MNRFTKATLLLCFFLICAGAFLVSHRVRQTQPPPAPQELFAIVNSHVTALRADDFRSAYRYAASGVQQKFTLPQFEKMARRNYSAMSGAQRVEFGSVWSEGGAAVVQVFVLGSDNLVRVWRFALTHEPYGWRISGVEELDTIRADEQLHGVSV
jgi:hypothetical protein